MRVIFMGTPDFAVNTLEEIVKAGHEVIGVYTQPDRQKGRGKEISMSPVKQKALEYGLSIYQPEKVRKPEIIEQIKALQPEVIVVVAFGQILPKEILECPKYGCVNVHASLLPKYRGSAPIQWAVIDGEEESGVTTMQMDEGIDTGDILLIEKYRLAPDETGGSLFDKLAVLGAKLLIKTLDGLLAGSITPVKQQGESSYAGKLEKSTGKIDFTMSATEIERLVRGLNPWPSAYTTLEGKTLKIWKAAVVENDCDNSNPGTVYRVDKHNIYVSTKEGGLRIDELQLEGKKRMDTEAFLRGFNVKQGTVLG